TVAAAEATPALRSAGSRRSSDPRRVDPTNGRRPASKVGRLAGLARPRQTDTFCTRGTLTRIAARVSGIQSAALIPPTYANSNYFPT
ncbi:hypothetical protein E4U53_005123, partial [Claviceps sorghi]